MIDLAEVAGRTHEVASALNGARAVLGRVEHVLSEEVVDQALTRRLSDVQSFGRSAERVSRLEQDAGVKRQAASRSDDPRAVAQSEDADAALRSAFRDSLGEAGNIPPMLRESWQDLGRLRDDLQLSSEQLKNAMEHADALDRMPEYDGPKDQLANVRGVKAIVDRAEEGVADVVARIDAARTIVSRFEQDPPVIRSGQLAEQITSTSNRLRNELSSAQETVREVRGPAGSRKADVAKVTDQAIGAAVAAKDAKKADEALAKSVHAGTTPRPASAQHTVTNSQQDLRRRLDGKAQDTEIKR
jgi:hypothetical protein